MTNLPLQVKYYVHGSKQQQLARVDLVLPVAAFQGVTQIRGGTGASEVACYAMLPAHCDELL